MAVALKTPELQVEGDGSDYAKLVMEPMDEGFGTTVGNALRRVLLSSLPGAAITSVRIEGVDHEFSTVEYMQEDVTELLLNLKQVRLRTYADRPARLLLEVSGAAAVKAGDIQSSADYEITNPELHLATLDDPDAVLVVDLNVETGRGYLPAIASDGLPIGVIPVDALFTPVRRVSYQVSNARVGQETNFDRLEFEVWTDGTVDGQMAIAMAAEILREQLFSLQQLGRPDVQPGQGLVEAAGSLDGYDKPIEDLDLSVRAYNCLKRSGLTTVGAILERSEEELLALRNFGEKSYEELRDKLVEHGFPPPRGDSRRVREPVVVGSPDAAAGVATAAADPAVPVDEDTGVSSLGAALIQALREAGDDSSELAEDH